jgi:phosphoheptose isomerase
MRRIARRQYVKNILREHDASTIIRIAIKSLTGADGDSMSQQADSPFILNLESTDITERRLLVMKPSRSFRGL